VKSLEATVDSSVEPSSSKSSSTPSITTSSTISLSPSVHYSTYLETVSSVITSLIPLWYRGSLITSTITEETSTVVTRTSTVTSSVQVTLVIEDETQPTSTTTEAAIVTSPLELEDESVVRIFPSHTVKDHKKEKEEDVETASAVDNNSENEVTQIQDVLTKLERRTGQAQAGFKYRKKPSFMARRFQTFRRF